MRNFRYRATLIAGGAALIAFAPSASAPAQESLPTIDVHSTPKAAKPRDARAQAGTEDGQAANEASTASETASPRGALPIVVNQFATVTSVSSEELRSSPGATLGEVLFSKPGITASSFAPGAASRPIVRGLDNYRVRIQENGISAGGVSELGEDHAVPLDPLGVENLEVVRGPATLRWGSQAIGGVVNATNNRIPDALPCNGQGCTTLQTRGAISSVDSGLENATLLDAGYGNIAIHADAFGRQAGDYLIPGYPYLYPPDPAPPIDGRQPNSAMRSGGGSIGGSNIFDSGFVGVAVTQFNSLYRIPGADSAASNTRIDLHQTKITSKGEFRPQLSPIEWVRFWAGATNYTHHELGFENGFDGIQQTFANNEQEARVEAQIVPHTLPFATLTTSFGVQATHQRLASPGVVDNGLFDPNWTTSVAAFLFNEFKFSDTLRMQVAGRIEQINVKGSVPDLFLAPDLVIPRDRNFTPKSVAIGFLKDLPLGFVASLTAQHVERAPKAPELFSRGAHDATGTFDIGNPNLSIEAARTVELGLRRNEGRFHFQAAAYYSYFNGFIFRNLTGQTCEGDFASCTPLGDGGGLRQAVYAQRNTIFRGGELQSQFDVAPLMDGFIGVENQFDVVRATFAGGGNVPRIPPIRVGGGVFWHDTHWLARINLLHAFAQNNIAAIGETPTPGYNLLKAEISYRTKLPPGEFIGRELAVGVVGDNLLNESIRNSASFKKDEVLLPGANVRVFANFTF